MAEPKFLDFLDRIDGGGAGQSGDTFEGGGLLSLLGNLLASPYGSEDPERMAARQAFYNSDNIGGAPMTLTPQPQVMPDNPAVPFQPQPVVTHPVRTDALDEADRLGAVRPQARPFEPNYTDRFTPLDPFTEMMDRLLKQGIPTGNVPR